MTLMPLRILGLLAFFVAFALTTAFTQEAPAAAKKMDVSARAIPVEATQPGPAGTSWQLVKFVGGNGKVLTALDRSKYQVSFAADGSVTVRIDCNRGRGTWKAPQPGQLEFGPLALTRAMCPAADLTSRLTKDWGNVRSYHFADGHLFLAVMADGGTYEFEQAH
ncbi:META domain-containing protein [Occallatibacter riparius]|uniref:META domain-containing protein n=1 Tax=Occallatibacter riparius TaxID=1002689 RepID=A0A9J7BGS0_9BACT|nr:META domain-containing protein [Occallatibacter riparius]UWZ81984.1 META domain-containing protein [Occallatibacter riparius]